MALPYENSSAGAKALADAEKILRKFGCSNFGVMTDWARGVVIVQFSWKERQVHLEASWRGYAAMWLKEHPFSYGRTRRTKQEHDAEAQRRGEMAVPSILRDWIKGQVTAVEIGLMPFDHAFMPHMLLPTGGRLIDKMQLLLEAPKMQGEANAP
jgi:hypothetical protein